MGPRLMSYISVLAGEYHLSIRKIQRLLRAQYGVTFSVGAISEAQGRISSMLTPTHHALKMRIPVKLNSDSGICEHHFRKVCGQGFFEQKLSFEGRHLFDSLNKPAAMRSAAVVDPRRWNRTVHLTSEYVH